MCWPGPPRDKSQGSELKSAEADWMRGLALARGGFTPACPAHRLISRETNQPGIASLRARVDQGESLSRPGVPSDGVPQPARPWKSEAPHQAGSPLWPKRGQGRFGPHDGAPRHPACGGGWCRACPGRARRPLPLAGGFTPACPPTSNLSRNQSARDCIPQGACRPGKRPEPPWSSSGRRSPTRG